MASLSAAASGMAGFGMPAAPAGGGKAAPPADPPFAAAFSFSVDGVLVGRFTEVSGLAVTMAVEEIAEGGNNQSAVKRPGPLSWPNLVLKRGITADNAMLEWLLTYSGEGFAGKGHRVDQLLATLTLFDSRGRPVRRWSLREVMPVRWTGPQFAADGGALATEELEVCHGGFTVG